MFGFYFEYHIYINTHYFTPKLYFYASLYQSLYTALHWILYTACNIYTIQINHNNSYENYMRLERNKHEHEQPSTLRDWLWSGVRKF